MPARPVRQGAIVTAWREMGRRVLEDVTVVVGYDAGAVVTDVSSNVPVSTDGTTWTVDRPRWVDVDTSFGFEVY